MNLRCFSSNTTVFLNVSKDGANGYSRAVIELYKRSNTKPQYDGDVDITYTFSTNTISGLPDSIGSWSISPPEGDEPLYVIHATAFANTETDVISIGEWTNPVILSEHGTDGSPGATAYSVILYQRAESAPSKPTEDVYYNIISNEVSNAGNWSNIFPNDNGLPCWAISATAFTNTESDNITPSEWSDVIKLVESGAAGKDGRSLKIVADSNILRFDASSIPYEGAKASLSLQTSGISSPTATWTVDGTSKGTSATLDIYPEDFERNWISSKASSTARMRCIAHADNIIMMGGVSGALVYSTDNGDSWATVPAFTSGAITGLCYNKGRYVAVDSNGKIFSSANIESGWPSENEPTYSTGKILNAITTDGSLFVAVGETYPGTTGIICTSTDGLEWQPISTDCPNFYAICYDSKKFHAVGAGGIVWASEDGARWTQTANIGFDCRGISYDGKYIAGGQGGNIAYSNDGKNWYMGTVKRTSTTTVSHIRAIASEYGVYYSVCYLSNGYGEIWKSHNGRDWEVCFEPNAANTRLWAVSFASGFMIASGDNGNVYRLPLPRSLVVKAESEGYSDTISILVLQDAIGTSGADGVNGSDGVGIESIFIDYQISSSGTEEPTGDWDDTYPNVPNGNYLWTRTTITYTDGNFKQSTAVTYMPNDGQKGDTGEAGKGIASITKYYATTQTQTQPSASDITSATLPTLSATDKYLWCKEIIKYTRAEDSKTKTGSVINITNETGVISSLEYDGSGKVYVTGKNLISSIYKGYFLTTGEGYTKESNAYRVYTAHLGVGTYTFSASEAIYLLRIRINTVNTELLQQNKTTYSFTLSEPAKVEICVKYVSGAEIDDSVLKCQIEQGSSATAYAEPSVADTTLPITLLQPQTTLISSDGASMTIVYGKPAEEVNISLIGVYGDTGEQGVAGSPGKPAKTFSLILDKSEYIRDLRDLSSNTEISISVNIQGHIGAATVSVSKGTYSNGVLVIPYNNDYDSVEIVATLDSDNTVKDRRVVNVKDITQMNHYFGLIHDNITEVVLNGDYFTCDQDFVGNDGYNFIEGIAYEYNYNALTKEGEWNELQAKDSRVLTCLTDVLASDITVPVNSAIYTWTEKLIAMEIFAEKIKSIKAEFDDLTVNKTSIFGGVIKNDSFETVVGNTSGTTYQATAGSESLSNNLAAQGVLGKEVKASVESYMSNKTPKVGYSASGTIFKNFNKIMYVDSVKTSTEVLETFTGNTYTEQTFKFTNTKPVNIEKLYIYPTRKKITETYYEESGYYYWEAVREYEGGGNTKPNGADRWPPDWDPTSEGERFIQYADVEDDGNGGYTWTVVVWESFYEDTSGDVSQDSYGSVVVNGTTYQNDNVIVVKLAAGSSIDVKLTTPNIAHGGSVVTRSAGSVSFKWIESENYSKGILFINNGAITNYLSELTDGVINQSVTLTVDGSVALNLPMKSATSWTFNGEVHKLFNFSIGTSYGQGSVSSINTADATIKVIDMHGTPRELNGNQIYGLSFSAQRITVSGTSSITVNSTDYVRYCNLKIATYSKSEGVYSKNILPMESDKYSLGSSSSIWTNVYCKSINGYVVGTTNAENKTRLPSIGSDGVMEVGQYIDFHCGGTSTDYSVRLTAGDGTLTCSGKLYGAVFN